MKNLYIKCQVPNAHRVRKWQDLITPYLLIILLVFGLNAVNAEGKLSNYSSNVVQTSVSGTVTDNNGAPLPGVNVIEKGTTNGTQTDFDGNFAITVSEDAVLVISFLGFATQEITVGEQTQFTIQLEEDASELDEVVVTGYATQTRGDLTGSVASVDLEEATKQPIVNAAEALEGRVSGVTVLNNGAPGSSPVVRIRGFGSPNSNDPLYIIDGVQTDDPSILNSINPTDIAQMNVLKDGAASIYGARATNGVVIITTKGGGYNMIKPIISFDAYMGFARATNQPDLLNAQQHGAMIFESLRNDGADVTHPQYGSGPTPVVPSMLQGVPVEATVRPGGTDWLDELFRTAPAYNAGVSLQNGNDFGKYLLSVNYLKREGIQIETGYERAATRLNSEFKITDKLRIGEHLNVSFSNTQGGNNTEVTNALRSSPLVPVRDDNGNFAGTYNPAAGLSNPTNPIANLTRAADNYVQEFRVFGDIYASLEIFEGLTAKTVISADIRSFDQRNFLALNPEHSEARSTNTLTEQNFNTYGWVWTNTVNYTKSFGEHNINAVAGIESLSNQFKGNQISVNDYLFETPDFYLLSNGGAPNVDYAADSRSTLFSVFGTANYNYAGKYFVTATVRRDKTSRFLGDKQSGTFPAFSVGWIISEENFFPQDGFVDRLKLKASYGELGNQTLPISNPQLDIFSLNPQFANYYFNGSTLSTGAILSAVGNPNIGWETSVSKNFGLEAAFFDNKLDLSLEFYQITTEDLILQDNTLISTTAIDATPPYVNFGSIKNNGIDLSIGFHDDLSDDFYYNVNFNLSHYKNEVTELVSAFIPGTGALRGGPVTRTEVGRELSQFYGRQVVGVFSSASEVSSAADQGFATPEDGVGRFQYADINDDGVINDDDRTYIGSPHPDFTYGLNLNVGYKGFDLTAFFTGSQGNDIYNYNKIFTDFPTFFNGNRSTRVLNSFSPDNPNASLPALSQTITNGETEPNSFFVEDGSFLRLKNLQIGYTFPNTIVDRIGIQELRVYIQGTNLFTISDYDGVDPEIASSNSTSLGIDANVFDGGLLPVYPLSQIYTLGFNVKL